MAAQDCSAETTLRRSYAARMSFYRQRRFQCEVSGRQNLTFFEAHTSELLEAEATQKKFPASLKGPVLKAVQFGE